jgi:hypothetical protein
MRWLFYCTLLWSLTAAADQPNDGAPSPAEQWKERTGLIPFIDTHLNMGLAGRRASKGFGVGARLGYAFRKGPLTTENNQSWGTFHFGVGFDTISLTVLRRGPDDATILESGVDKGVNVAVQTFFGVDRYIGGFYSSSKWYGVNLSLDFIHAAIVSPSPVFLPIGIGASIGTASFDPEPGGPWERPHLRLGAAFVMSLASDIPPLVQLTAGLNWQ